MNDIWNYLVNNHLLIVNNEARKVKLKSSHYVVFDGEIFWRGFSIPLLKCVDKEDAQYFMEEIHRGIYGFHLGGRSMTTQVLWLGYYWPTLWIDCMEYSKKWRECQEFGNLHHSSPEKLHNIHSLWPFTFWGMDILELFPIVKGQVKFLLVAIDYFTKWIEAKELARITTEKI